MQEAPTIESYEDIAVHLSSFIKTGDKVALLLDYDGTLAPLVSHPSMAVMEPESEAALKVLSKQENMYIAIISGRGAENVRDKVGLDNATYAGNHGLEILYANGTKFEYIVSAKLNNHFTEMVDELREKVGKCGGAVENKLTSVSYDYRRVPEELRVGLANECVKVIQSYGYIDSTAHLGIEGRPPVHWNKGFAAELILKEKFGDDWASNVKVIFAGDDTTDEDVMEVLKGIGMSFRVETERDLKTYADFLLPSTKTVSYILEWLVDRM